MLKTLFSSFLVCGALLLTGCSFSSSSVEQRVVELPANDPNSTLDTAAKIGQGILASGMEADIQKQFPSLTPQQLRGAFLTWNIGIFQGKQSVFFLTGIRYTGTLPEAKAIADYCEARVKKAVAEKFPNAQSK
jgi:hypothetical protein